MFVYHDSFYHGGNGGMRCLLVRNSRVLWGCVKGHFRSLFTFLGLFTFSYFFVICLVSGGNGTCLYFIYLMRNLFFYTWKRDWAFMRVQIFQIRFSREPLGLYAWRAYCWVRLAWGYVPALGSASNSQGFFALFAFLLGGFGSLRYDHLPSSLFSLFWV